MSLYVAHRKVVIVGADERARSQAHRLRAAGARVAVAAPDQYHPDICRGAFAVMAYGEDSELNRRVAADARALGCLGYAHDQPDESDFAMPAVARRGPLALAISTDATAPALAGRLRRELQALLDRAGHGLDRLLCELWIERSNRPRGSGRGRRLAALAGRLRFRGELVVDPEPTPTTAPQEADKAPEGE